MAVYYAANISTTIAAETGLIGSIKIMKSWVLSEEELITDDNDSYIDDAAGQEATDIQPSLLVSFTVILATLLIIGVVGNILVILVLIRAQWQARHSLVATASTTNAYILNLSAADLLFLVFCAPFHGTVYILNHWPFGWVMCKLAHYCQFCTVYANIWILTTMSVDRYVAIGHPLKSVKWRHPTQATKISIVMWMTAALVSVPWLILYETDEYGTEDGSTRIACYDAWSDSTYQYRKWMILFGFLIGFLIPSLIIFCMALLIAKSIRLATHQPLLSKNDTAETGAYSRGGGGGRLKRRRRVGWLVFALSLVFFICWGPHNISLVWLNFDASALDWINEHYQAFFIIKLIAHMMTYLNSSINPLLYSIGSNQFFGRLAVTCGLYSRSPTAVTSNCRTFANRTLHANSVLIQYPVSRSNSASVFTKRDSSNSLKRPTPPKVHKTNGTAPAIPRRAPVIPSPSDLKPPTVRRHPAPSLGSGRRVSSAFVLTNSSAAYQDAVPLITKKLNEAKKICAGMKTSNSTYNTCRTEKAGESVVIANPYAQNGSVPACDV